MPEKSRFERLEHSDARRGVESVGCFRQSPEPLTPSSYVSRHLFLRNSSGVIINGFPMVTKQSTNPRLCIRMLDK